MGADYFAVSTSRKEALWMPRKMGGYIWYNCENLSGGKFLDPEAVEEGTRDYEETSKDCPSLPYTSPAMWDKFSQWLDQESDVAILYSDVRDFPRPWRTDPQWQFFDVDEWPEIR